MSTAEIIDELPKLPKEELARIRAKLDELDPWIDPTLSDADKAALNEALAEYDKNPDAGHSWDEVEAYVRSQLRR
jgi:hypothetical protein